VLAALSDARVKARNSAKNSLVLEYVKALELYRSDHEGIYPGAESGYETDYRCLGYAPTENCQLGFYGSTALNNALLSYLPNNFAEKQSLDINGYDFRGISYACVTAKCEKYMMVWYLENKSTPCINKATSSLFPYTSIGPHNKCFYTIN